MKFESLVGKRFGKLVIASLNGYRTRGKCRRAFWNAICDCGETKCAEAAHLKSGNTRSCGCLRGSHQKSSSKIYLVWQGMMARCYRPNRKQYKDYGGRGIKVADEWHSFANFYKDMGDPLLGMTLERKDNNLGYSKSNCKWATRSEQQRNRRGNRHFTINGETLCFAEWEERLGLPRKLITKRVCAGWSVERAVTTPKYVKHQTRSHPESKTIA